MKTYYPVHSRDNINGRFEAWLGEAKQVESKPDDTHILGDKIDKIIEWFETKEAAINYIMSQCKYIIERPESEFYGRNWL